MASSTSSDEDIYSCNNCSKSRSTEIGYGLLTIAILISISLLMGALMQRLHGPILATEYTCAYIAHKVYDNTSVVVCNGNLYWAHEDTPFRNASIGTTFQMWSCPFTDDILYDTEPICTPNPYDKIIVAALQVLIVIMVCTSIILIYAPKIRCDRSGYIPVKTV